MKDINNILETLPKRRRPAYPGAALRIILEDDDTTQQDFADRLGIARHNPEHDIAHRSARGASDGA
jgi:plasmid maintenance system antidote protein VapI